MHYSGNTLAMQPKKIPVPFATITFDKKTYIFKLKDQDTINQEIHNIKNSPNSIRIPVVAITLFSGFTGAFLGGSIGNILDKKNSHLQGKPKSTRETIGTIFGTLLGLGISYYIVVANETTLNETLTNDMIAKYLEQKQDEYNASPKIIL